MKSRIGRMLMIVKTERRFMSGIVISKTQLCLSILIVKRIRLLVETEAEIKIFFEEEC